MNLVKQHLNPCLNLLHLHNLAKDHNTSTTANEGQKQILSGQWLRWWSRKTLNSPPPTGTSKITTIYRVTIYENDLKTRRKDFPQLRYKEGTTMRQVGGAETWYSQDPHLEIGNTQKVRQSQLQRFSPRSEGSESHIRFSSLEVLHQE